MKQLTTIGNLGANAVRRTLTDGKEIMSFSVAVNAGRDSTLWVNCVSNFRENLFPYLLKGQCVCVIGDLSAKVYKDTVDLNVSADKIELCGARKEDTAEEHSHSQVPEVTETHVQHFDPS